jgi:hypothetical protein
MLKQTVHLAADENSGPQLREAIELLIDIIHDGLRHGHFRFAISSGIVKNNRRELIIEAGKSHKFTIPEEELPRWCGFDSRDPCGGDARDANQ